MTPDPQLSQDALRAFIAADEALTTLHARVVAHLDGDPGHDLGHLHRVALWTLRLGGAAVDRREAIAAALLHDIVNLPKDSPDRALASTRSAEVARRWLPDLGFSEAAVGRVADGIRDHSFSRGVTPTEPLGQALQDADRLEAVGVIGLFRCVSTGARMGARYFEDDDPWAESRPLDDRAYSIDHFFTKLLGLAAGMNTAAGRHEGARRTEYLRHTLAQLAAEIGVDPPL